MAKTKSEFYYSNTLVSLLRRRFPIVLAFLVFLVIVIFLLLSSGSKFFTNKRQSPNNTSRENNIPSKSVLLGTVKKVNLRSKEITVEEFDSAKLYTVNIGKISKVSQIPVPTGSTVEDKNSVVKLKIKTISPQDLKEGDEVQVLATQNFFGKSSLVAARLYLLP